MYDLDCKPKFVVYSDGVRIRGFRRWYDAYALFVELLDQYTLSRSGIIFFNAGLLWVSDDELHTLELFIYEE